MTTRRKKLGMFSANIAREPSLTKTLRFRPTSKLPFAILLITLTYVAAHSQSKGRSSAEDSGSFAGPEWSLANGDWQNSRYSTLSQINAQNVKDLRGAWVSQVFDDGAVSRSTPVIKDGLMFVTAGTSIYALNPASGEIVWKYRADSGEPIAGMSSYQNMVRGGLQGTGNSPWPNTQGVAVGEGLVFAGLMDGQVIALNEKTGQLVWNRQIGDDNAHRGQAVSAAPLYARGMVFAGLGNGDFDLRGRVVALNAENGKEMWHFFSIPDPGETGSETWPKTNDSWRFGGGGVWQEGVVDPDLGMVYFAPGNTVPQTGGDAREGDNLFTCSLIALDMKTGKLRWYYQFVHHDLWDADGVAPTPLVLYDAQEGGKTRKAIAAMRGDGYLFLLDRQTGKMLIPVEERPVPQDTLDKTAATQPFPKGAESVLPECSDWKDKVPSGYLLGCTFDPPSLAKPNVLATGFSVRVSPMSYSPQTGYFYAQGSAGLALRRRFSDDPWFFAIGGSGSTAFLNLTPRSFFVAIDSKTDKIVWRKEVPPNTLGRSGSITTAGGLMFRGGADGNFQALDAKTGALLWQFQTGAEATPASTYEINGVQYVAMAAGTTTWAFKLGGSIQPKEAKQVQTTRPLPLVSDVRRIETSSLLRDMGVNGQRYATDEYTFNPLRSRVQAGTPLTWINNGRMIHTLVAQDGSWTTGTLQPTQEATVTFDKPGTYTYICKEHPWSMGQVIVVANAAEGAAQNETPANQAVVQSSSTGFYSVEQANRGRDLYVQNCSGCHQDDLSGYGQAPALAGQPFMMGWQGRSVGSLFERISTTMPRSNPGSLSQQTYLDIVAFLLESNGLPAGREPLRINGDALRHTLGK